MVQWQMQYLKDKEKTYSSDTGTIYLDLPDKEQISMILLELSVSNVTNPTLTNSVLDVPTKIELLLNGSKTAFSCTPEVGSYMAFLASGRLPPHELRDRGTTYMRLPIYLGRWPFDENYLLDTDLYNAAQVQIAYSLDTSKFTTGTTKMTAWYLRPQEKLNPVGFIRQRIVKTESLSATAGEVTHELPTDLPVLDIGFRAFDIDQFLEKDITDVKLDIGNGTKIMFDGRIEDLLTLNERWFGPIRGYHQWLRALDGDTFRTFMGFLDKWPMLWMCYSAARDTLSSSSIWGSQAEARVTTAAGAAETADQDFIVQCNGLAPHSCLNLLHTDPKDPFPLNTFKDAKVVYTQGAYAIELDTFLREVVLGKLS